ncbi:MAG: CAP domain-containing protein [bacterium]
MTLTAKLRHIFTPHHTNNFRAKMLHNSGILAIIGIVVVGNIFFRLLSNPQLHILGFTSTVTIDEVVRATNEQRASAGLKQLSYNEKLADAARRKAANMFSENYWAHNSPSGKSPWVWFKDAGYNYVYAGENLAKDFGSTSAMMSAWMASPTHRDNVISSKYSEIGVAVVPGSLEGQDTVLVVQLFGSPNGGSVPTTTGGSSTSEPVRVAEVKGQEIAQAVPPDVKIMQVTPASSPLAVVPPKYNQFNLARTFNLATTLLFIFALILDLYIAESSKLTRRVGNNWAHILFINLILLATTIVNAGKIL